MLVDEAMVSHFNESIPRLISAPHMWQLGWLSPQLITKSNLAASSTLTLTIPAQTRSSSSGVKISPSWTTGSPNIYLGYRIAEGPDANLGSQGAGLIHVRPTRPDGPLDFFQYFSYSHFCCLACLHDPSSFVWRYLNNRMSSLLKGLYKHICG